MLIPPLREQKMQSIQEQTEVSNKAVLAQCCAPHPLSCRPGDNLGVSSKYQKTQKACALFKSLEKAGQSSAKLNLVTYILIRCLERELCPLHTSVEGLLPLKDSTSTETFFKVSASFYVKATLISAALLQEDIATKLTLSEYATRHARSHSAESPSLAFAVTI